MVDQMKQITLINITVFPMSVENIWDNGSTQLNTTYNIGSF